MVFCEITGCRQLRRADVRLMKDIQLGEGNFGAVYKGSLKQGRGNEFPVASTLYIIYLYIAIAHHHTTPHF